MSPSQKENEVKIKKSKNPITGLINPTGEPDSGKTTFAFSSGAAPERTVFIDDDVKGKAIVEEIKRSGRKIGLYHNLVTEGKGLRELEFHDLCLRIIDEIEPDKYDVLIWDTWTRFENTFHPVVANDPLRFRKFYSAMGQIKGAEQWAAAFDYEASVIDTLTNKVPLVIVTSHLKKNEKRIEVAESKKPLIQKARMRVWLRHTPNSPVPTGLMLKRISKVQITDDGIVPVNVTHRKVYPFTWQHLIELWNNPVGNTSPNENEKLNEFELSILDGVLTRDQKDVLRLAVIEAEREREEQKALEAIASSNGYPKNKIEFLSKAQSEMGLDANKVTELLGHSIAKDSDFGSEWNSLKGKVK